MAAREEERRRLRRDLHDGLGPNLASQGLKLAAAKQLLNTNPPVVGSLLEQVMAQNQTTVDDIRRLVYNLRPPALDELGLAAAVRDVVSGLDGNRSGASGLRVQVETAPAELPPLPAAVEVAAYRIALEALTNVMRHARARRCTIRFALDGAESGRHGELLRVEIVDDGAGVPAAPRPGVGMISMRERAEELGGRLSVAPAQGGGTRIVATLPLAGSV